MNLALVPSQIDFGGENSGRLVLVLVVIVVILVVAGFVLAMAGRFKRCPPNRILVKYGKTGKGRSAMPIHGGATWVVPLIHSYAFLELEPLQIEIPLEGALSAENIRVSVPSVFTVAVGTDEETMNNAAVRLLGLDTAQIVKQAEDIIFGQMRHVIASMGIQEINRDRDVFLEKVQTALEPELKKIGLVLINVNIRDIKDESGYIEAIGRKAASTAINQAEIDVAEQQKLGAIGVAAAEKERAVNVAGAEKVRDIGTKEAERERAVRLAELEKEKSIGEQAAKYQQESELRDREREMRVRVAEANAKAVTGENKSKAEVAATNAELRVREAEAFELGEKRFREAQAAVLEAQYRAEARAATAQAEKIEAETRARLEATSKAEKAKTIVDAEAQAQQRRIEAEGEAAAIFAKLEAEARGQYELLAKKADGLKRIVDACGGSQQAFQMLMLEHLEVLSSNAAKAISNVKFDKVVVWDSGPGTNGTNATASFLKGLGNTLPPMLQIMKDVGGVEMPEFIGRLVPDADGKTAPTSAAASAAVAAPPAIERKGEPRGESKK